MMSLNTDVGDRPELPTRLMGDGTSDLEVLKNGYIFIGGGGGKGSPGKRYILDQSKIETILTQRHRKA